MDTKAIPLLDSSKIRLYTVLRRLNIMAKSKELKTNAMRILDRMKISYQTYSYECDEFTDAQHTADQLGFPHEIVYKTLVTVSPAGDYYVFVLPIDSELDLKKAAHEAAVKSLSMIHVKDITAITGYVRGGCTAIGMKKQYPVFADSSAQSLPRMIVSAGKIGHQIELAPNDFINACRGRFCSITRE